MFWTEIFNFSVELLTTLVEFAIEIVEFWEIIVEFWTAFDVFVLDDAEPAITGENDV